MIRQNLMEQAIQATCSDRNQTYGEPVSNMEACAKLQDTFWTIWQLQGKLSPEPAFEQAMNHALNKLVRIAHGDPTHVDNFVDAIAYLAIAGEAILGGPKAEGASAFREQHTTATHLGR